jgi:hypothetical protein
MFILHLPVTGKSSMNGRYIPGSGDEMPLKLRSNNGAGEIVGDRAGSFYSLTIVFVTKSGGT